MTHYGRWTYKYEIGAMKGAAGVLIVHETGPAGYCFNVIQGKTGEQFDLVTPDKNMGRAAIEGWITLDQATKLLRMSGQDFDALKKQAVTREFKPVPLGVTASMTIRNTLRTIDSKNVMAKLVGSDPALKDEYVVYTAHWDHFGKTAEGIFHGARDNASGTAALLEIGRAFTQISPQPKRSIIFIGDGGRAGPAQVALLRGDACLSTGKDRGRNQHGRAECHRPHNGSDVDRLAPQISTTTQDGRRGRKNGARRWNLKRAITTASDHFTMKMGYCAKPDQGWLRKQAAWDGARKFATTGRRPHHTPKDVTRRGPGGAA
jgi:hypothetical protein